MRILVLGAGAWGTALASAASANGRHAVALWARDPAQALALQAQRSNSRYLPGIALPDALAMHGGPLRSVWMSGGPWDLVVIATPMAALRDMLQGLADVPVPLVWLCKGFETVRDGQAWGLLGHEVQRQAAPQALCGALSGPSFALEVAQGKPTALVAASAHAVVRQTLVDALHGPAFRVYASDDLPGVEVGGAVKNVLAVGAGLSDGLGFGANARMALITRGLHELVRLGVAVGAQRETFMGLAGLGDLVLTCTDNQSRNRRFGLLLASGITPAQALHDIGQVVEGYQAAQALHSVLARVGVEMPICSAIYRVLYEHGDASDVMRGLMSRPIKAEFD